jgi:hypothetical protein
VEEAVTLSTARVIVLLAVTLAWSVAAGALRLNLGTVITVTLCGGLIGSWWATA